MEEGFGEEGFVGLMLGVDGVLVFGGLTVVILRWY